MRSARKAVATGAVVSALGWATCVARSASGQPADPTPAVTEAGVEAVPDAAAPPVTPVTPPPAAVPAANADAGAGATMQQGLAATSLETARYRYANTWDLNLEGGAGGVFGGIDKWTGFVRARPGILVVRNDDFYQAGVTAEYLGLLHRPAFGLQVEYLNLSYGGWFQLGGSIDTKGRPGANAALGLSIFGIEGQIRQFDQVADPAFALIGKIRLPLGILAYGLRTKK